MEQAESPPFTVVEGRLRVQVCQHCPQVPGVYGMVDASGELIYVGKAKNLRARLLSYFRPKSRDPKAGRILEDTRLLAWEPGTTEFAALLRELELIRRWQPRFNVQGQPRRQRRGYVCLGRSPAPYAFVASHPPPKTALVHFGPVPAGEKARQAARRLNDLFKLRDCPRTPEIVFADQTELFPLLRSPGCLRHDIGTCTGPCAALCSATGYGQQIERARAFLEGKETSQLDHLEAQMHAASASLAYERAAALRDKLAPLRWLQERLTALREARTHSFIYTAATNDDIPWWYLIQQGRARIALPRPESPAARKRMIRLLETLYQPEGTGQALRPSEVDGVLLVAAWFRRHPEERLLTMSPQEALATLRFDDCGEDDKVTR
jgi:excinuclease ABC subunit C